MAYSTPQVHVSDVTITTVLEGSTGTVGYDVQVTGEGEVAAELRVDDVPETEAAERYVEPLFQVARGGGPDQAGRLRQR